MPSHHCVGDGIGAMEMVESLNAPRRAFDSIHRHARSLVLHIQKLDSQAIALAIGQEEGTAGIPSVVRVKPHHGFVLEATLPDMNKVRRWILQGFSCLLRRVHIFHLQLLCLEVELTKCHTTEVAVHDFLEILGALSNGIPPCGLGFSVHTSTRTSTCELHRLQAVHVVHRSVGVGTWLQGGVRNGQQCQRRHGQAHLPPHLLVEGGR
mmetsp:Transcript_77509/g.122128  ORF Transcript_77509/g.122128 Transcript_77509/m.122128 type:complete len:208 (-) Transcript_77509:158-781(-)